MATPNGATDTSQEKDPQCEEIIIDITVKEPKWGSECCIYKVPERLRKVKEEAYTPKLISIGPVHHNNSKLKDMQKLKKSYFMGFFYRTCKEQKEFASIVKKNIKKIRDCYAVEISLTESDEDLVKMILLDSIFIIELFSRSYIKDKENDDYILSKPWLKDGITQDLILLENQLPFFILDMLFQHFSGTPNSFFKLACNYFFPGQEECPKKEVKHFTDWQRYFFRPPDHRNLGNPLESMPRYLPHRCCATKLHMAGLIFENPRGPESKRSLLNVHLSTGTFRYFNCSWLLHCLQCLKIISCFVYSQTRLEVPQFVIDKKTEDLFRNLMALEQCHYSHEAYICNYILLLGFLINDKEDVELLVEKRIIVNSLGRNEAIFDMIDKLGHEIREVNSYYHGVVEDLNRYYNLWNKTYRSWWNQNMATLKTVYFRDIWRGTATIVGIIVLAVTILNSLTPFFLKNI